jgi:phosphate-selective porin OprO/OprP
MMSAPAQPVIEQESESIFDKIWGFATLYEGDGPVIQELSLIGRYHGQWYDADADEQGSADGYQTRRSRLGVAVEFFNKFSLEWQFNVDLDGDEDRFFEEVEDAVLEWDAVDGLGFEFALGKQKPTAGREYNTSSKRIKTIERSLISNQVMPEKLWGLSGAKEMGDLELDLGIYAGDLDGDWGFTEFDGGIVANIALTYNDVRLSYLYDDGDENNTGTEGYDNIVSLSYVNYGKKGYEGFGFFAEGIYAEGNDRGDAYGITIMPSYMITSNLEAILRYHYAGSDGDSGIRAQSRYDRRVDNLSSQRGDAYQGVYGGINYYIYGDKLKLMGGVEYGSLDQDNGDSLDVLTFIGGVRLYF